MPRRNERAFSDSIQFDAPASKIKGPDMFFLDFHAQDPTDGGQLAG